MSTIPELLKHCRELMTKAVESTKRELTGIRSGKASTASAFPRERGWRWPQRSAA